jgi:Fungal Zn(2)-Cys(6) binuclear cluster domain.
MTKLFDPEIGKQPKLYLEEFTEQYSEIHKYLSAFQVKLSRNIDLETAGTDLTNVRALRDSGLGKGQKNSRLGSKRRSSKQVAGSSLALSQPTHKLIIESSITVFKTKNFKKLKTETSNIYEHNLSLPDIDLKDSNKSKVSCIRCRKFKKKCSRIFPECSNCLSSDELCIYLPRKVRGKDTDLKDKETLLKRTLSVLCHKPTQNSYLTTQNIPHETPISHKKPISTPPTAFNPGTEISKRLSLPNIPANGIIHPNLSPDNPSRIHTELSPPADDKVENYSYNSRIQRSHSKDLHLILN